MLSRWLAITALAAPLACAQDAGLVLRTLVTYRTQLASGSYSPEQKAEAEKLGQAAQAASSQGKLDEALRQYGHGFAVMQGVPWTPGTEMAAALQTKAAHLMIEPGQPVAITLEPLYKVDPAAKLYASVMVAKATVPPGSAVGKAVAEAQPVDAGKLPVTVRADLPADVVEKDGGNYVLTVLLSETPKVEPGQRVSSIATKRVTVHVEPLAAQVDLLRKRLALLKSRTSPALPTAQYAVALYELADHGDTNPSEYDFHQEFANAGRVLDALEAGRDPWAGQTGDQRRAYRSSVDGTLQPYRLFIPETTSSAAGATSLPLVVALHGMGGDENTLFDAYGKGAIKQEAAKHGFVVVCPKGRDSASMYRGAAEQDVMDVMAEVRRALPIDAQRIYLMGHSMGAYGTFSIAMDHPDLFAALGPISGGGNAGAMERIKNVPEYVTHGDNDKTVNVSESRKMVEAGRKAGAKIEYVEVPGGSHVDVAVPAFAPMFDFFAKQQKPGGGASTGGE